MGDEYERRGRVRPSGLRMDACPTVTHGVTTPRCINCQNFNGCQGGNGICRVWQVVLPAQVASINRCEHWTAPVVR